MFKNIILHIGLNKTVSTFIQQNIIQKKNSNHYIQIGYKNILTGKILEYLEIPTKEKMDNILKIVSEIKEDNILISHEGLAGHHYNGFVDVNKNFKLLEKLFDKPKYIICFREPSSIIYSGYFQRLQKYHSLLFEDYINKDLNDLFKSKSKNFFQTNYKIFNYNIIFKDYLNIQSRVLFIEFENFFKNKEMNIFNNFVGTDFQFDWSQKINKSLKDLIYLEFYNKFILFKYIKIIWLQINKFFYGYKKARDVSIKLIILIRLLIKITPKRYLEKIDSKHQILLENIKNYHLKDYNDFKNKLSPDFSISSH